MVQKQNKNFKYKPKYYLLKYVPTHKYMYRHMFIKHY